MSTQPSSHPPQSTVDPILDSYRSGHQTLLVSGRSLFDLHINEQGELRPLRHTLTRRVREEFAMATLLFNLALGPRWNWEGFDTDQRRDFEARLDAAHLPLREAVRNDLRRSGHDLALSFLLSIQRTLENSKEIPPLMVLLEWGEDIVPNSEQGGISDYLVQMNELLAMIGSEYLIRRHPFLLILSGIPERMDRRVVNSLQPVHLPQPEREEKIAFIQALNKMPHVEGAAFESGLDSVAMANLTARTPNQSLEAAFLESARSGKPISHARIVERKRADVVALSDGTILMLDTERVAGIKLVGRTIERALALLRKWGQGLKIGDRQIPMNIMLAGAPSTAKTDLALITALESGIPAYELPSPKSPYIGQSEQRARQQQRVFKELWPAIGFIDEITEAFPMQRSTQNLDSGASDAVSAEMLNALADTSRAGRTLLIATTNCPWRVGSAMASRFIFLPILSAVLLDYPQILCAVASRLLPDMEWDPENTTIKEAAEVFFRKGASPRVMRVLIASKMFTGGGRNPQSLVQQAAADCAPQHPRDRAGAEYADLFAISVCTDLSMLPWHGRITDYPLPQYLQGIVSETDGSIDVELLNRRITELKPHVNV